MEPRLKRYGIAVASVAAAWGIREALVPLWGRTDLPFVFFQLAVVVAAWLGRAGPGLLAAALSACTVFFFFRKTAYSFAIDEPADFLALLTFAAVSLCVIVAIETMHRAQQKSRDAEQKLGAELDATQRLQKISNELVQIADTKVLYDKILDTAVSIMGSDFASIQILHPERVAGGELRLIAHRGFTPQAAKAWEWVGVSSVTSCGEAFRLGRRVIVPDLLAEKHEDTPEFENYSQLAIRAVQSTPLYSRSGAMLGMLSTHWRERHEPTLSELRLLDVLARLAADLIDRIRSEEGLREADRQKDEFLAMLGHELRNPLGVISTVVQLLRIDGPPDTRLQDHRITLELQVKQMTRLLDDLLDVSRIARGVIRLKKAPCDLAMIVRQAVQSHRPLADQAGLSIAAELPDNEAFCVTGDQARLSQIVGNLLYNAIKFTGGGGRIVVRLSQEQGEKAALLTARDTGVGIERDMLHRIFEPFVQAEATLDRSRGGLGIGLALVKGLVALHDGEVWVSSEGPGRGSEFTVRLPLTTNVVPSELKKPMVHDKHSHRILIIEDNLPAAQSLQALLLRLGHTVEIALNGSDGLAAAQRFMPGIVLCDIGLPGLDGYSVARAMRQSPELRGAYLIAVTGYGREGDRERALEAGFDRYLTKPVDPSELERLISGSIAEGEQANA